MSNAKAKVAIDGPAGAGKSTAALALAKRLGFVLVDTGALYRGVALEASKRGISVDDGMALGHLAEELTLDFRNNAEGEPELWVNGKNVASAIRAPSISQGASDVSRHSQVRDALLKTQRRLGEQGGVVLEGRDIGTVVFPDAEFKFFLTASVEARAKRRLHDLEQRGIAAELEEVHRQIEQRDAQDSNRSVAPLKAATDAQVIDSTDMSLEQVVSILADIVQRGQSG